MRIRDAFLFGAVLMTLSAWAIAHEAVTTEAWAQPAPRVVREAFDVTLHVEEDPVASRIEGLVHNHSAVRVTDVRVGVRGLDADGRAVGRTVAWVVGDIVPGGESSFVFEAMPAAVTYDAVVISYDLVSAAAAPVAY